MENAKITKKILNRWNNSCIWEGEISDHGGESLNIGEAAKAALASDADLRGASLRGASLRDASLAGASLRGAILAGASLAGADLRDADLRDADLRDADLRDADLSDASLAGASLAGASLRGAILAGASLAGADLRDADLRDADLRDADLRDADLSGAILAGASLAGASLRGASLIGKKIKTLRVFSGLYEYQIWAYVLDDGAPWVRMGCQNRSVAEWDEITIRESRTSEFPNDGSARSERRARAFEFARAEALIMAQEGER